MCARLPVFELLIKITFKLLVCEMKLAALD